MEGGFESKKRCRKRKRSRIYRHFLAVFNKAFLFNGGSAFWFVSMVKIRSDCIFLVAGSDGSSSLPLCFVGLTWTDEICLSGEVWIAGAMGL
ncbi:hypothetical protein AAC387_Pa04g2886 [Persea americana]